MDMALVNSPVSKPGLGTRILIGLAGGDEETLRECPASDWGNVRAIGVLMILVWCYQAGLLSIVAHQVLAPDGAFHPALVAGSAFIASLLLVIDSYCFLRASFHADGVRELARAGLDISGGWGVKLAAGLFLTLRILLSLGFAQLTGIFVSLYIFHADIAHEVDRRFQQNNAALISAATHRVDAQIQRTTEAEKAAAMRVDALENQLTTMRQGVIDPAAADSGVAEAQAEVRDLQAQRDRREAALRAAQIFASNELAGIKAAPGNSGVPGNGPVRAAAEERVQTATVERDDTVRELADARTRLEKLRQQARGADRGQLAKAAIPQVERDLGAARQDLAGLRKQLADRIKGRDEAVRHEIENSPEQVGRGTGMLAQLVALRRIAQDPEILAVILLIDLTSFGLELAAVLAKVTTFIPTTYALLLARNAYLRAVETADEIAATANKRDGQAGEGSETNWFGTGPGAASIAPPPKRPRGRPRKDRTNGGSEP